MSDGPFGHLGVIADDSCDQRGDRAEHVLGHRASKQRALGGVQCRRKAALGGVKTLHRDERYASGHPGNGLRSAGALGARHTAKCTEPTGGHNRQYGEHVAAEGNIDPRGDESALGRAERTARQAADAAAMEELTAEEAVEEASGEKDATLALVRAFLAEHGAADDEIAKAEAENVLDLLAADRLLVPEQGRYTVDDVSRATGMEADVLRSFWRALGFADVIDSERAFTDLDVEAIVLLKAMIDLEVTDVERAIHLTRVIGASMARIADAIMAPVMTGPPGVSDTGNPVADAEPYTTKHAISVPVTAKLLEFVWRRHAQAAVRRAMLVRMRGDAGALPVHCVGFADMVGFTEISQQLSEDELGVMVGRFEEIAHDTVTARGGRLVKMIGDEAMFVADSAVDGALIATNLAEAYADDEMLADVRVSLAFGGVLLQDGDYFGPTVNLASRSVGIARPGSVVVMSSFRDRLAVELEEIDDLRKLESRQATETRQATESRPESAFVLRALRPRRLKGLGWVPLWVLERPGAQEGSPADRASNRWERLAEVLKDLGDVHEKGERLLAGDRGVLFESGSGLCDSEGRYPEGPQSEASLERLDRSASQVARATLNSSQRDGCLRPVGLNTRTSSGAGSSPHCGHLRSLYTERRPSRMPSPSAWRLTSSRGKNTSSTSA